MIKDESLSQAYLASGTVVSVELGIATSSMCGLSLELMLNYSNDTYLGGHKYWVRP